MNERDVPSNLMNRANQISMFAMGIVVICVAISLVLVVLNERATQNNADFQAAQNEALQQELRCLRPPALEYDKQMSELQISIARALIALSEGREIESLAPELSEETIQVEQALQAREMSLVECTQ